MFGSCCPIAEIEFSSPVSFVTGSNFAIGAGAVAEDDRRRLRGAGRRHHRRARRRLRRERRQGRLRVQRLRPERRQVRHDPARPRRTTAPRSPRRSTARTASTAASSDQNWASFLPAMQSLGGTQRLYGHQGNLNGPIAEQFPELTQDGITVNAYPNIEGPMWDDYRAALEEYDAPGPRLEQPRRPRHVGGVRGVRRDRPGHGRARSTTTRSWRPPTRASAVDTGGMAPVLDLSTPWDGMGGAYPRIFNRTVTFDRIDDGVLTADRRSAAGHDRRPEQLDARTADRWPRSSSSPCSGWGSARSTRSPPRA